MSYTYRYQETKEAILEALNDLESVFEDNLVEIERILEWVELYNDLQQDCLRDRYFNSCFGNFPCMHTEKNIEYQFSMLYYAFHDLEEWREANIKAKTILPALLSTEPDSKDEQVLIDDIKDELQSVLFAIYDSEIENDKIDLHIYSMDFGDYQLSTKGLEEVIQLSKLYWQKLWE